MSGRLTRKEQKQTLTHELLADTEAIAWVQVIQQCCVRPQAG